MPTPVKPVVHPEMFSSRYASRAEPLQNASHPRFREELAAPAKFFGRFETLLAAGRDMPEARARRQWFWPLRRAFAGLEPARAELERAPVLVFDPAAELVRAARASGRPQYLATDTHWRPEAMGLVARRLAAFVRENVKLPDVPRQAWRREQLAVKGLGDIAVMMKLPAGQRLYPPETAELGQLYLGQGEAQRQWRPEVAADVLLLGDSFSNIYSAAGMGWGEDAGLAEQLSFELGRPVDALVRNDSGAYATREMLSRELARGFDRLAGKRVVIWQFAARELAIGDWRMLDVPAPPGR
jgi:alginate O-acetyltransferase complex protein AlgJ